MIKKGWRKSSYSADTANCVEFNSDHGPIMVRDSKLGDDSPIITISRKAWSDFCRDVKTNRFA